MTTNQPHAMDPKNPVSSASGFSISLGPKKPTGSSSSFRKPSTSAHGVFPASGKTRPGFLEDDEDDGHDDDHANKIQIVTGFTSRGGIIAEDANKESKPLMIAPLKNKDWREESRKKKGVYLPPEAVAQRNGTAVDTTDSINHEPMRVGLQFVEKSTAVMTLVDGDSPMPDVEKHNGEGNETGPEKSEDQLALEALLSKGKAKSSNLLIPAAQESAGGFGPVPQNEDEAYRIDVASRPDMATLDDYAAVPVEEFGAALLRGMGWKEGQAIGRSGLAEDKARIVEKRPAFLGIGAKGMGAEEIGAWGKADKKGRQRVDKTYLPVTLVDKNGKRVEEKSESDSKKRDGDRDSKRREDGERSDRSYRERDYHDYSSKDRYSDRDRDRRDREKERDRPRERERDRGRRDRDGEKDRYKERDRRDREDYDDGYHSSRYDKEKDRKRYRSRSRSRSQNRRR